MVIERLWRRFRKEKWVRVRGQFWMLLDPQQFTDKQILSRNGFEPTLTALLSALLKPGDAFIDVGAHKGYFSLLAAALVGAGGKVYSFDPDPRPVSGFLQNIQRNGFSNIRPHLLALSDKDGFMDFTLTNTLGNSSFYPNELARKDTFSRLNAPCFRFDELNLSVETSGNIVVKIDAEGAEYAVIEGMKGFLKKHKPVLVLEVNLPSLAAAGVQLARLDDLIRETGLTERLEMGSAEGRMTKLSSIAGVPALLKATRSHYTNVLCSAEILPEFSRWL